MSGFMGGVSTSFTIQDYATATLNKISDSLKVAGDLLDNTTKAADAFARVRFGGVTRSLGALSDQFDTAALAAERLEKVRFGNLSRSLSGLGTQVDNLAASSDVMAVSFESAMTRMSADAIRGEAAINSLEAAMARAMATAAGLAGAAGGIRVAPGALGGGGAAAGGRGGGHGGGRAHLRIGPGGVHPAGYMPLGGGMGGIGAMIAGIAGYEALKWSGEYDMGLRTAAQALGESDINSERGQRTMQTIGDTVLQGVAGTRFSEKEVAPDLADFYGKIISGLPPDLAPDERARRLKGITATSLRFAETETMMGHGTIKSEMGTASDFAHLFRKYTPEEMGPFLDRVLSISQLSGQDPANLERTMKYMVTTGELSGADPSQMLDIVGFLMQSGVGGTTAGTGPAAMMAAIDKARAGDPTAKTDVHHRVEAATEARRAFSAALHNNLGVGKLIDDARKGPKESKATAALEQLKILDPKTHDVFPQFKTPGGGLDEVGMLLQMAHQAAADPRKGPGLVEMATGGQRGARVVGPFMAEGGKIFETFVKLDKEMTENLGVWKRQLELAQAPLQRFEQLGARIMDFGTELMNVGGSEHSPLHDLGVAAKGAADALSSLTGFMTAHGAETSAIVKRAAEGAVVGGTAGLLGGPGGILGGAAAGAIVGGLGGYLEGKTGGHVPIDLTPKGAHSAPPGFTPRQQTVPGLPPPVQKESYNTGGGVQVHIQNVSFAAGTPREHAEQFAQELTSALSRAQLHDLGTGWGHQQSSFSTGRTLSA